MEHQVFLATIRAEIATFLKAFPEILFAVLYGSAVEGMTFRDLDLALWVDRSRLPSEGDLEFEFRVESQMRQCLPFVVDVRVVNDAPLSFRYHVSRGIPLLVRDEDAFTTFQERTWDDYFDFRPISFAYLKDMKDG